MSGKISDNTGSNYGLKVDSDNHAHVRSFTSPQMVFQSSQGRSYIYSSGLVAAATSVETPILWIRSDSETLGAHVSQIFGSWNGGATNHDRSLIVRLYAGGPAPTANETLHVPINLLSNSANIAPATAYTWDGVGAGMTVSSNGSLVYAFYAGQGITDIPLNGALILNKNSALTFTVEAEEAGGASVVSTIYFATLEH